MRRILEQTAVLLGCALVGMQFVPTSTRPRTVVAGGARMAEIIDPPVGEVVDRACKDCHSDQTRVPWYGHVAPVSWILSRDVNRGRAKLDFSQWAGRTHSANERMEICDAVSNGSMPLHTYTVFHRNARPSEHDVDLICDWAATAPVTLQPKLRVGRPTGSAETLTSSEQADRRNTKGSE